MSHYTDTRHSPYTPAQLYAMVMDIERYPEFLPWCRAARIKTRESHAFVGELVVSFSGITERYSSRVTGVAPAENSAGSIDVTLVEGPFKHLTNYWRFEPEESGGTKIHFEVDFKFKSALLDRLIGGLFSRAVEKMSTAFATRADALYSNTAEI